METKPYNERREYSCGDWKYLLDDDDRTAWIVDGVCEDKVFALPEDVYIEGNLYKTTSVELGAFSDNEIIEELVVPDCYEYIDQDSFHSCKNLKKIHIGKGIERYWYWSFSGCPIEEVVIDEGNPYIKLSDDGRLVLSKDGKNLQYAIYDDNVIKIPYGVEVIEHCSISCKDNLSELYIPSTVKKIEHEAFVFSEEMFETFIGE